MWEQIGQAICAAEGKSAKPARPVAVAGGCINQSWRLDQGARTYFVKTNRADRAGLFAAETEGLQALGRNPQLRIPRPICQGLAGDGSFLVLEWLDLVGQGDAERLGRALAAQHRICGDGYGGVGDNFIGTTPQPNPLMQDWAGFFARHRLGWQLELAAANGHHALAESGLRLGEALPGLIGAHAVSPSLLHGDLWSGNHAYLQDGCPVLFDPAVYYGDREADLAMTELFGGFADAFHAAYREAWPLAPGYAVRREVYNLYHVLNHLNLFGGGYAGQARRMIERLLAEAG